MPTETQPWDRFCLLDVQVHNGTCYLASGHHSRIAQQSLLDENTGLILTYVTNKVPHVSFLAVIGVNFLSGKRGKTKKSTIKATINFYGPRSLMGEIDRALSDVSSYLQHPVFLEPNVLYINPQFFYSTVDKTDLRHLVGPPVECDRSHTTQAVDGVIECMDDWSDNIHTREFRQSYLQPLFNQYLLETKLKEYFSHEEVPD